MKKNKILLILTLPFIVAFLIAFLNTKNLYAAIGTQGDCTHCSNTTVTDCTIIANCSFPHSGIDGVDSGTGTVNSSNLTISSGYQLTVLNGQTILVGTLNMGTGGEIYIYNGGQIKLGKPIYVTDADGDGYADSSSRYETTITGRVRIANLTDTIVIDCDPSNASYNDNNCPPTPTPVSSAHLCEDDQDCSAAGCPQDFRCTSGYCECWCNNQDCEGACYGDGSCNAEGICECWN